MPAIAASRSPALMNFSPSGCEAGAGSADGSAAIDSFGAAASGTAAGTAVEVVGARAGPGADVAAAGFPPEPTRVLERYVVRACEGVHNPMREVHGGGVHD